MKKCRLPEYPKLTFTLGPQVVCLECLPQVRQQASALAGQLYKALIHVIVTQRGGHLKGALTNADVPQHIGDARPPLEKSRMLEDDAYHNDWSPIDAPLHRPRQPLPESRQFWDPMAAFLLRICSTLLRVNPPSFARVSKA